MSSHEKWKHDDTNSPYINCWSLSRRVKYCLRRHVAFSSSTIFDVHFLLKVSNFLHEFIIREFDWILIAVCLYLTKPKVNQHSLFTSWVPQNVWRFDIPVDYSKFTQMLNALQNLVNVSFLIFSRDSFYKTKERHTPLIFEDQRNLWLLSIGSDQVSHIIMPFD